jgi:hypothetical protein
VGGAEVYDKDLVLVVVDDGRQGGAEMGQLHRVALAEKDGELGVVAAPFEVIEDLAATFVVGNVVGDDVVSSGCHLSFVTGHLSLVIGPLSFVIGHLPKPSRYACIHCWRMQTNAHRAGRSDDDGPMTKDK